MNTRTPTLHPDLSTNAHMPATIVFAVRLAGYICHILDRGRLWLRASEGSNRTLPSTSDRPEAPVVNQHTR